MPRWLIGLAVVGAPALLAIGAAAGAYFAMTARFNPQPPKAVASANASPLVQQREDLSQFARLIALDRSYSPAARVEAERRIAALAARRDVLAPAQLRMALMGIAALADNGHTSVYSAPDGRANLAPIRLRDFAGEVRVVRAKGSDMDLLGAELTGVGGKPVEAVIKALTTYRGGTYANRRDWAITALSSPELLFGAGLNATPTAATYAFRLADGRAVERTLQGEPQGEKAVNAEPPRWLSPQLAPGEDPSWRGISTAAPQPLALADPDRPFRLAWPGGGCIAYVQLRANHDVNGQSIGDFQRDARRELERRRPCGLVLDLRYDGGGDYTLTSGFAHALPKLVGPTGRIAVLTGVDTFSAGITTAAFVKDAGAGRALIVGEPVGDRLSFFSEGGRGCLPHARLCVHYSTGQHRYDGPCSDWRICYWLNWLYPVRVKTLAPDAPVRLTYADYMAGRDPALDAAMALARPH